MTRTKKITTIAMLAALAYVVMAVGRIPISTLPFLKYDPKDIVITIGGFIFGPLVSFLISIVVSFIEMFTVSETRLFGFMMNILSSCAFCCTASYIYKKKHDLSGAVMGLLTSCFVMAAVMLLYNYMFDPYYFDITREQVAEMLLPIFLPFNLLKGGLNVGATLLLYKPVVGALRKSRLVAPASADGEKSHINVGLILFSCVLIATCILLILVTLGIL